MYLLRKATVSAHARRTKDGGVAQVREYQDRRPEARAKGSSKLLPENEEWAKRMKLLETVGYVEACIKDADLCLANKDIKGAREALQQALDRVP